MQRIILLLTLTVLTNVLHAEVEPNNTSQQANSISVGGYGGYGIISTQTDVDWWKITTSNLGKLKVIINAYNVPVNYELYNSDGTTLITSGSTSTTDTIVKEDLSGGNYYLKLFGYTNGVVTQYNIYSYFEPTRYEYESNNTLQSSNYIELDNKYQANINSQIPSRDTADWFKFRIFKNCRLRVHIVPPPGLTLLVSFYYIDYYGKQVLIGSYPAASETDIDQNGLGGNYYYYYYMKVSVADLASNISGTYTFNFVQYSNFNDLEPNNSPFLPLPTTLQLGGTNEGNLNYYTTNDSIDWYKITTLYDGDLQFTLRPHQGHTLSTLLYQNNRKTLITSVSSDASQKLKAYGLAKGTYYVCIKSTSYNPAEWQNYTLSSHFSRYLTPDDDEPNDIFSQAQTIPANGSATGHINFKSTTIDSVDTWKINYTGTGNMKLNFSLENRVIADSTGPVIFQLYKELYKPPIYSNNFATSGGDINLTGLKVGYYFIKLTGTQQQPNAYTIMDSFVQAKTDLNVTDKSDKVVCDNKNYIKVKCLESHAPYKIERYRYNQWISTDALENSLPITYTDIPWGIYKFRGYADGATGNAIDSQFVYLLPIPITLTAYNITGKAATIEWNRPPCNSFYSIRYRPVGALAWTIYKTINNTYYYDLNNLTPNTTYEWQVAPGDTLNGLSGINSYSVLDSFTTANGFANKLQQENSLLKIKNSNNIIIYPNPAQTQFVIQYNAAQKIAAVSLTLKNVNGVTVWSKNNIPATAVSGSKVYVDNIPSGVYVLTMRDKNSNLIATKKVIVSK